MKMEKVSKIDCYLTETELYIDYSEFHNGHEVVDLVLLCAIARVAT